MFAIFNFIPYVLKRSLRHWQVLLTLSLGVLLATALLASGPLLIDTVVQFGLRSQLTNSQPGVGNIALTSSSSDFSQEDLEMINAEVEDTLQGSLGSYLTRSFVSIQSRWLYPWVGNVLLNTDRLQFRYQEDLVEQSELVSGGWPEDIFPTINIVQGAIGEQMAQDYDLSVGDLLPLSIRGDEEEPSYYLEVTGIIRPKDFSDIYWFGEQNPLLSQGDSRWEAQYSVILPEEFFFEVNEFVFDRPLSVISWKAFLDHSALRADQIGQLDAIINQLPEGLARLSQKISMTTGLDEVLVKFAEQAQVIRAPLYLLTAEVVLLSLYYVVMVAALAVQQVEREFSILGSRGAEGGQIFQIQLGEASIIAGIAVISGPVLGVLFIRGLATYGPLQDVAQPGWGLSLTSASWIAAGVGALTSILGLLLPVGPALRRSIVAQTRSLTRKTRTPIWQRLYLDVFLLVVGLIFFIRLRLYGGIAVEGVSNSASIARVDWLLLLSPLALMIGSATILLRIFPLLLRMLEKITARGRGMSGILAMWQAARNPDHVARLVLLLTLAMALGLFSTGLNATLDRSEFERAQYLAGTDFRLIDSGFSGSLENYFSEPNINGYAEVYRGKGSLRTRPYARFEVLGVDPYSLASISHFRDDYSEIPMGQLLGHMVFDEENFDPQPTYQLPGTPVGIGMWVWAALDSEVDSQGFFSGLSDLDRVSVSVKMQTALGDLFTVELAQAGAVNPVLPDSGNYPEDGWAYFNAAIPILDEDQYPLHIHSIWFQNRARWGRSTFVGHYQMNIVVDDLTVVDQRFGEPVIVTSFENPAEIWSAQSSLASATDLNARSGVKGLSLSIIFQQALGYISLSLPSLIRVDPLPVLVSPKFIETSGLDVGDKVRIFIEPESVYIEIKGVVNYFPTMFEVEEAGFLIAQKTLLLAELNSGRGSVNINEYWLRTDGAALENLQTLSSKDPHVTLVDADGVRRAMKSDPMALGLRSVTTFGFVITAMLSLVGFATYFYISARQRETNYGILRSIGLAPTQLYISLVLEQVVLIFFGLALGTGLGVLINLMTLSGLPINLGEQGSVPPFIPYSDWNMVGNLYAALVISFMATLGIATILLWRSKIHRALRIGEE